MGRLVRAGVMPTANDPGKVLGMLTPRIGTIHRPRGCQGAKRLRSWPLGSSLVLLARFFPDHDTEFST